MAELLGLRSQVPDVVRGRFDLKRDPFGDGQTVALEPGSLVRVVRQQAHRPYPEIDEDLRPDPVLSLIRREPELDVRLDRVTSLILQLVGAQLVSQADRAAFVSADVQDDAPPFRADQLEGPLQLAPAVAPERAEHVTGEALRVDPGHDLLAVPD